MYNIHISTNTGMIENYFRDILNVENIFILRFYLDALITGCYIFNFFNKFFLRLKNF